MGSDSEGKVDNNIFVRILGARFSDSNDVAHISLCPSFSIIASQTMGWSTRSQVELLSLINISPRAWMLPLHHGKSSSLSEDLLPHFQVLNWSLYMALRLNFFKSTFCASWLAKFFCASPHFCSRDFPNYESPCLICIIHTFIKRASVFVRGLGQNIIWGHSPYSIDLGKCTKIRRRGWGRWREPARLQVL